MSKIIGIHKARVGLVWTSLILSLIGVGVGLVYHTEQGLALASHLWIKLRGQYSVADRLKMHGPDVAARLQAKFAAVDLPYPPTQLAYVAFKDQAVLEVYARSSDKAQWQYVLTYPILGLSGQLGPKLREGDLQVPEGIYRAEFLNANSRFHLSIRLNYPNAFEQTQAQADGRTQLGSDIMIHGTRSSIGCLAMGNLAAEDLFILAALVGKERLDILIAPTDFRRNPIQTPRDGPQWLGTLYEQLNTTLTQFPLGG